MKYYNHIILEGFWGIGKTTVAKKLQKAGFSFLEESNYLKNYIQNDKKRSNWYKKQHRMREKVLGSMSSPFVLERTELSTFAYNYLKNEKIPPVKDLLFISKLIKSQKILPVYLSMKNNNFLIRKNKIYSKEIKEIIKSKKKIKLYDHWYTSILPEKYGITFLQIDPKKGQRKNSKEIVGNILLSLRNNRIGQVNVIVCRYNLLGEIEVLILKRVKKRGGFWQNVTGGINVGESFLQTAKRELKEELSIKVKSIKYTGFSYSFIGNEGFDLREYVCSVLVDYKQSEKIKISTEHEDYKWLLPKDAIKFLKFKDNKKALKYAIKNIRLD